MQRLFALIFAALLPLNAADFSRLPQFIEEYRKGHNIPGIAVSIVDGRDVVLSQGFGLTDVSGAASVDENTLFQLASVTKTITAAAVGIEVAAGKTDWDRTVAPTLCGFTLQDPYSTYNTNALDLLAHRTGLPAFGGDLLSALGFDQTEILQRVRYIHPAATFRERALYSNVGYFIAGEYVGALAGRPYEEVVKSALFQPLNMTNSGFFERLDSSNIAHGHALIDGVLKAVPADRDTFSAAGGAVSSAKDMANWMIMLLNQGSFQGRAILTPEVVKRLFEPAMVGTIDFAEAPPIGDSSGFDYSPGFGVYYYKGYKIVEKGGALDGVRTVVTLIPELQLGITVLTNRNLTMAPEAIRAEFLETALGRSSNDLQQLIAEKEKEVDKLIAPQPKPQQVLPMPRPQTSYAGTFANDLYGTFTVTNDLQLLAGPAKLHGTLTHYSNDTFTLIWPFVNAGQDLVTFTLGPDGLASSFAIDALGTFTKQ